MEPRVLQHDEKGDGEPIVLVPGGLTGWLSWMGNRARSRRQPRMPYRAHRRVPAAVGGTSVERLMLTFLLSRRYRRFVGQGLVWEDRRS